MLRKFIITVICSLSIFALCAVPSYAAGFGGGQRGGGFGSGGFSSNTVSTYLSYDALSALCTEVNYNLERNVYASDGFPSSGKYAATIVSRSDGYYIGIYKAGSYTFFRNFSGGFYICEYNTDSLLSSLYSLISTRLDWNFSSFVSHLDEKLAPLSDISSSFSSFYDAFLTRLDWNFSSFVSHFDDKLAPLSSISSTLTSFHDNFLTRLDWSFSTFVSHFDEKIDPLSNSVSAGVGHLNSINNKLNNLPGSSPSDLFNIESALSTIINKMDNLPASVDNIVVNITEDNSAYNIFFVEDENGDKKSVTSVAGDSLSASGKLLQFLYKLIIGSAISDVDNSIGGLNDFFFDNAPSGLGEGVTVWD